MKETKLCCDYPLMVIQRDKDTETTARYGCSNCETYTEYMPLPAFPDGELLKGCDSLCEIALKRAWSEMGYMPLDWVSVEDDYPRRYGQYDVIIEGEATKAVYWDDASFHDENAKDVFPTHWAHPFLIAMSD